MLELTLMSEMLLQLVSIQSIFSIKLKNHILNIHLKDYIMT